MSGNYTSQTSSSYSYSSSTSTGGDTQTQGQAYSQETRSDPSGTTVQTSSQRLGEPVVQETREYDAQGRELLTDGSARLPSGSERSIQDVSENRSEADKLYEERIEDEYAKREGGA